MEQLSPTKMKKKKEKKTNEKQKKNNEVHICNPPNELGQLLGHFRVVDSS